MPDEQPLADLISELWRAGQYPRRPMPEQSPCRSCGAPMLWVRTTAGNLMPLDLEPVPGGNIVLKDGLAHVLKGDLFEGMIDEGPRYVSHFVTCPEAAKHRRKKS